ncbi:transducin beta-like protein 2 isoform X2 [Cataglyphis hispanica]|uniref:transducin beta-like protein 2 isoform X2 n=1 Tax=Cataglyphis hispanica TaxID=1086592 RepID=UPI00218049EC|nr:transducin beta-like protein 2 isoform X2 [Cataglyphis hispanica]
METTPGSRNMLGNVSPSVFVLLFLTTLIAGGIIFLIRYAVSRRSRSSLEQDSSKILRQPSWSPAAAPLGFIPIPQEPPIFSHTLHNGRRIPLNKKRNKQVLLYPAHPWLTSTLRGHTGIISDMSFSNNGRYLASCADDRTVLLWYTKDFTSKNRKSLRVNIEFDHATLLRWSPDGKAFIIHKAMANTIEVYKIAKKSDGYLASATKALEFPRRHTEDVVGMDIASTGKYIITCSTANDLIIWDLKGQPLATVEMHLGSTHRARISPCGRFVAASGFTPEVNVWEVVFNKSGEFKQVMKAFDLAGHTSGVHDFAFSADTSRMATVSKDGTYRFYDIKIEFEKGEDPHLLMTGTWDNTTPASLALSPNAEVLVIAHGSSISFYSTITGVLDTIIQDIFVEPITCLAFDAMGEYILVAGDKHIKIFRNITGCRTTIESAKRKLEQRQTQATKERLEKMIRDNKELLEKMGEKCPE